MIVTLLVTVVFIAAGMLPTMISYYVVRRPGDHGSTCILMFNLAGLLPVLDQVWSAGGGAVIGDIFAWYVIYMVAALGYAAIWLSPYLANGFFLVFASRLRGIAKARQAELYREWGSNVVVK